MTKLRFIIICLLILACGIGNILAVPNKTQLRSFRTTLTARVSSDNRRYDEFHGEFAQFANNARYAVNANSASLGALWARVDSLEVHQWKGRAHVSGRILTTEVE